MRRRKPHLLHPASALGHATRGNEYPTRTGRPVHHGWWFRSGKVGCLLLPAPNYVAVKAMSRRAQFACQGQISRPHPTTSHVKRAIYSPAQAQQQTASCCIGIAVLWLHTRCQSRSCVHRSRSRENGELQGEPSAARSTTVGRVMMRRRQLQFPSACKCRPLANRPELEKVSRLCLTERCGSPLPTSYGEDGS